MKFRREAGWWANVSIPPSKRNFQKSFSSAKMEMKWICRGDSRANWSFDIFRPCRLRIPSRLSFRQANYERNIVDWVIKWKFYLPLFMRKSFPAWMFATFRRMRDGGEAFTGWDSTTALSSSKSLKRWNNFYSFKKRWKKKTEKICHCSFYALMS